MDSSVIVNSLGIGGIIFIVLLMVWFAAVYVKRRVGVDPHPHATAIAPKISWEEKRGQPRVAVSWQAHMDGGQGAAVPVQLRDISLGGAFVVCGNPLPLRAHLVITLDSPPGPLALNAEVVWSNIGVDAEKIVNRGMGIHFIDNSADLRDRLGRLITACFQESAR